MFTRTLNRVMPKIPVTAMRTFGIVAPVSTHFRPATCEDIGCLAYHHGWTLDTAGLPAELVHDAKTSGRSYTTTRAEDTGAEVLVFAAGQPCFKAAAHRVRVDRPEIFVSRNGDWRGNPDGPSATPTQYSGPDSWADALHTQLERCTSG
jgi:hypothetical protein